MTLRFASFGDLRRVARAACACAVAALAAAGAGCDRSESVTIYTSADEQVARPVFERFERETGIRVDAKFDGEATKTTGLANLLRSERERPRADIFWSNEQAANVALALEGLTVASGAPAAATWPAAWRDPQGRWCAFAARARVIVYRPDRVAQPPQRWAELADPKWMGRVAIADPRFGTTRSHFGAMAAYWNAHPDAGSFDAFCTALAANEPRVLTSGNAGVIDAVARGEAELGATDTDDVLAAQARGLPVAMVFPRHAPGGVAGGGTFLIPNTVAMVAGAPHPEAARRFIAFMLAPATERQLAGEPGRHAPIVTAPQEGDLAIPDPLLVDPVAVSAAADEAVRRFMEARRLAAEPAR
ncbi:MAG: extracellular solute-binding protein [Phycisphaerales bacterium]